MLRFWGIYRTLPKVVLSNVLFEVGEDQARVDEERYISEGDRSPLPQGYGNDMKQLRIMKQKELMSSRGSE